MRWILELIKFGDFCCVRFLHFNTVMEAQFHLYNHKFYTKDIMHEFDISFKSSNIAARTHTHTHTHTHVTSILSLQNG